MNDFATDDAWQKAKRDAILVPQFYGKVSFEGRYVLMDKGAFALQAQRRMAVDTIRQGIDGDVVAIEEKIVRWPKEKGKPHTAFTLETDSCTVPGHESEGWMRYGTADRLLYCFETECGGLDCHLIHFPMLKAWFWPRVDEFRIHTMTTKNRSRTRLVPIDEVRENVPGKRFFLQEMEHGII